MHPHLLDVDTVYFLSDSLTALRLVRDWPSAPGAHLLRAWKAGIQSLLDLHPDLQIVFQWCPGHSDILGNEWADSEAKEATKLAPSTAPPSISALKEKNTRQTMEKKRVWQSGPSRLLRALHAKPSMLSKWQKLLQILSGPGPSVA